MIEPGLDLRRGYPMMDGASDSADRNASQHTHPLPASSPFTTGRLVSHQNVLDNVAVHVRETNLTTAEAVRKFLMIQPKKLQYRRVEIVNLGDVLNRSHANLVRRAVHATAPYASPRHPNRKGSLMVVPAIGFGSMGCAAELSGPNHQSFLQEPSGF